jgi:hypothetical protein
VRADAAGQNSCVSDACALFFAFIQCGERPAAREAVVLRLLTVANDDARDFVGHLRREAMLAQFSLAR